MYFFWRGLEEKSFANWILFGIFSALGFLSKYLFVYILFSLFFYLIFYFKKNTKILKKYFLANIISLILLLPHLIWLFKNNYVTILYGLKRSNLNEMD